jgi:hypothetical protein
MPKHLGVAIVLFTTPLAAVAQSTVSLPKALIFPNYDNVLVGKNQALEGGAFIARTNDASANFYNPAGLVGSESTSVNASSAGYVFSRINSEAPGASISTSRIDTVPGYFGVVIGPPLFDTRSFRLGFSVTRDVSWNPGGIDQTIPPTGPVPDRVTFSTNASFQTQLYQIAGAWAPMAPLRVGLAVALAQTNFSSNVTLSGPQSPAGDFGQFLSTQRASGTDYGILVGLGVQWDIVPGRLTAGAIVRAPGIPIGGSSLVTQQSSFIQPASAASTFYRDDGGTFLYKLPFEAGLALAYRVKALELEFDLRYHEAVSQYDLYRGSTPAQVVTQANGTTTTTTQAPPVLTYSARRVFNGAFGADLRVGELATLHAGFYSSLSPVADAETSPFRKADLYGATGGVDVQFGSFGASLGAGYQFGNSSQTAGRVAVGNVLTTSEVSLQTLSIFYAFSYRF